MNERQARTVELVALAATPAAALLVVGSFLGFPLAGLLLGAGIGAGIAAAWETCRRFARGFEPLAMPVGGALGAAAVTLLFGVLYPRGIASAAAFGWGIGLAAALFVLVFRTRTRRRVVLAAFAALVTACLSLALSHALLLTWASVLAGLFLAVLVLAAELARWYVEPDAGPGRAARALAAASASGAVVGVVFGVLGQWWLDLGDAFGWKLFGSPWLTAVAGGVLVAGLFVLSARLIEVVGARARRRSDVAVVLAVAALALGLVAVLVTGPDGPFSLGRRSWGDDFAAASGCMGVMLLVVYLARTRSRRLVPRLVAAGTAFFVLGVLWINAWGMLAPAVTTTMQARSLVAMVPWKTSLGGEEDARPRLVQYAPSSWRAPTARLSSGIDRNAADRATVFGTAANARLARRFRCVILPSTEYRAITKRLRMKYSPFAVFLTPEGEEIDALWGG